MATPSPNNMNRLERWFLRRLLRKLIKQGPWWEGNVTDLFEEVNLRYRYVFYEDNYYTRKAYLQECLEKATKI